MEVRLESMQDHRLYRPPKPSTILPHRRGCVKGNGRNA